MSMLFRPSLHALRRPADFDARIKAIASFKQLDAAESLAAANKRVGNILAKSEIELTGVINHDLLSEAQEQTLAAKIAQTEKEL